LQQVAFEARCHIDIKEGLTFIDTSLVRIILLFIAMRLYCNFPKIEMRKW